MATVTSTDRCKDCKHCQVWHKVDHTKATCTLHGEQSFNPDRTVPSKCVGQVGRND